MKIAHIVSTYPPYYAGMGNVVFQTASHLAELGHEVEVFTPQYYKHEEIKEPEAAPVEKHTEEVQNQIDYATRLKTPLRYGNAAYMPQVKRELDDFDIVHLHYPFFGTANIVRKWKIKHPKNPLVVTYHMDTRGMGWKGLFFKYYSSYWMPRILGVADKILASSFDYIESSDARGLFEQNRGKWMELPFGVDTQAFLPRERPSELFARLNLDQNKPTLLFVGGMDVAHYFKGIPVLLKALRILKNSGVKVQAVLVGEGDLREKFQLQAQSYGLNNMVRFTGYVDNNELPYFYNMADLFVLPSINQGEAFGMVLLEAMASGVPVVASDLPGVRSVAQDGGLVFTPNIPEELAETIAGYFSDETNQDEWRQRARAIVEEKYTWEGIVKRLDGVYRELVVE